MDTHRKAPSAGFALTLAAGAAASVILAVVLRTKPTPHLAIQPTPPLDPEPPSPLTRAPAARVAISGTAIALDSPDVVPTALGDVEGQWRNYREGYKNGLYYRFGGSWLKVPEGEIGFQPFFFQGEKDGRAAQRPRIDDPETIAAWQDALGKPAVGEPGGPPQMYS